MKQAIRIHPADSVAVALQPLRARESVTVEGFTGLLPGDVPAGHKFALRPLHHTR